MAKKAQASKSSLLSLISLVTLLIILASVFVLSGRFSDLVTTITKSSASQANPKLTQGYADAFKNEKINEEKWTIATSGDASVAETSADNLRLTIPAGGVDNKAKRASLTFKEMIAQKGDFRIVAVIYRPLATGEGTGIAGVRFTSQGTNDDEGATLQWRVNGTQSKVQFVVRAPDGTKLESQVEDLASNIAVFRLERINKRYRAFYKPGRDTSGDVGWKALGNEWNAALGDNGRVAVFAHNGGTGGKFPKVVGRFDQANIRWEGEAATRTGFSDAFANGVIGKMWKIGNTDGVQVYENEKDNLIMSLPSGGVNGKPRHAFLKRTEPAIPQGKDFALQTSMFKPTVVGEGTGYAGLRFVSAGSVDDEAATLRWVVGTNVSRIVFAVRNPDGTLAERAAVNVPAGLKRATLRLVRVGNSYRGWYRTGDSDTDWVAVGNEADSNFGANGLLGLWASNGGTSGKFPRVVARFDGASGSVEK